MVIEVSAVLVEMMQFLTPSGATSNTLSCSSMERALWREGPGECACGVCVCVCVCVWGGGRDLLKKKLTHDFTVCHNIELTAS